LLFASALKELLEKPFKIKLDFNPLKVVVLCVVFPIFFKLYFSSNFLVSTLLFRTIVEEKLAVEISIMIARQALDNMVFTFFMTFTKVINLIIE